LTRALIMERSEFLSDGLSCVGYWHWPEKTREKLPVVLMGHGFGTEWRFGTEQTINDFIAGGFAVFTFDYRYYGESAGQPRHLLNVKRQLADWRNALTHVRLEPRIDAKRLVIWGSSLGGGHALSIASQDHDVAAVAAQVPHCNARASLKNIQISTLLRVTAHALLDTVLGWFGGVHTIPMLGEPDEPGAMTFSGWKAEGLRLIPRDSQWVNAIPARSMLSVIKYYPDKTVHQITCPVCIHYGRQDRGVPPQSVEEAARRIPDVEMHPFDGDHFDVYHGQLRAEITRNQVEFYNRVLSLARPERRVTAVS